MNIEIKVYMLVRLHNHKVVGIVNEVKIVGLWCVSFKLVAFIGVKISTNCMLLLLKYISTAFALQTTFLSEVPHYCFRIKFKTFSFPCVFPVILYVLTQNGISLFILRTNKYITYMYIHIIYFLVVSQKYNKKSSVTNIKN